ncbi:hypothetical protein CCP3SC15_6380002 [Gammaproteobacteria bacterium]
MTSKEWSHRFYEEGADAGEYWREMLSDLSATELRAEHVLLTTKEATR